MGRFSRRRRVLMQKKLEMSPPPPLIPGRFDTLPDDIIFNILMRLSPAASLVRCSCVCKNWNSIIRSQVFNIHYSLSKPQRYIFLHTHQFSTSLQQCARLSHNDSFLINHREVYFLYTNPLYNTPIASCNGLLCYTDPNDFGRDLCLWNPTIQKHKILASTCLFTRKFDLTIAQPNTSILVGLGFDSKTNDYKILRIVYYRCESPRIDKEMVAEIYSLSSNSWRQVEIPENIAKRFIEEESKKHVYGDGILYWLAKFMSKEGEIYFSILSFDVSNERFEEIELPIEFAHGMDYSEGEVVVLRGLVGLLIPTTKMHVKGKDWCVWTKNGSVWSKENALFSGKFECVGDCMVFHFPGGREATFVDSRMEIYKRDESIVVLQNDKFDPHYSYFFTFRESLVLL